MDVHILRGQRMPQKLHTVRKPFYENPVKTANKGLRFELGRNVPCQVTKDTYVVFTSLNLFPNNPWVTLSIAYVDKKQIIKR